MNGHVGPPSNLLNKYVGNFSTKVSYKLLRYIIYLFSPCFNIHVILGLIHIFIFIRSLFRSFLYVVLQ